MQPGLILIHFELKPIKQHTQNLFKDMNFLLVVRQDGRMSK